MIPQQVTERYVSNLLHNGQNKDFFIDQITRLAHQVGEDFIGSYYQIELIQHGKLKVETSNGATPAQALRRALEKHGVTFR